MRFYILNIAGDPVPCADLDFVEAFLRDGAGRIVQKDFVGDVEISTVFLSLDHNYSGVGAPILWETMIFGGVHDNYQRRYCSRAEALAGHQEALTLVGNTPFVKRKFKFGDNEEAKDQVGTIRVENTNCKTQEQTGETNGTK